MSSEITSPRHEALRRFLKQRRQAAELTQAQLASKMGKTQSFISDVEQGEKRVSVVEFLEFAEALGFDPRSAIQRLARVKVEGKASLPD
jgi:transcriptional regulator with XRE-family HTH domain